MTGFTLVADRLFPAIQETLARQSGILTHSSNLYYNEWQDQNGYLPTHNLQYNEPQRPHDPAWNAAHCRNRRIFNDRAGLAAGRCSGTFLLQTYERDMGGAQRVMLKEADAPVMVRLRRWGGFRLCYRIKR